MRRRLVPSLLLAAAVVMGLSACSDDAENDLEDAAEDVQEGAEDAVTSVSSAVDEGTNDAAEAAVRNLAATHGADEFEGTGNAIDGDLECEAAVTEGEDAIEVTCTGTTTDGEDAELTGMTSELPGASATELEGTFAGTVAGEEVFSVDRLG
jgi:ABC-type glycerol-3-phosphate transport system substrate-binding protein